jgi:hypothetical protein
MVHCWLAAATVVLAALDAGVPGVTAAAVMVSHTPITPEMVYKDSLVES